MSQLQGLDPAAALRAQVQSVIANIDTVFQPMEEGDKARVAVLSSSYHAFEIREIFHIRGRLFAEKKGQFIDACDQMVKAAGLSPIHVAMLAASLMCAASVRMSQRRVLRSSHTDSKRRKLLQ